MWVWRNFTKLWKLSVLQIFSSGNAFWQMNQHSSVSQQTEWEIQLLFPVDKQIWYVIRFHTVSSLYRLLHAKITENIWKILIFSFFSHKMCRNWMRLSGSFGFILVLHRDIQFSFPSFIWEILVMHNVFKVANIVDVLNSEMKTLGFWMKNTLIHMKL